MELRVHVDSCLASAVGYSFFLQPKTNQLLKFIRKCVRCMVTVCLYRWYRDSANTLPFNSWFVWAVKKRITTRAQGTTICNGCSIFTTAVCMFLWSDCYTIFTVLPETEKLYLPAISHWSIYKMPRKKLGNLPLRRSLYSGFHK